MILRRVLNTIALAVVSVGLGAGSASAHSAANSPSSDYVSALRSVVPATSRFSVRVVEAGSRLELTWRSGGSIIVEGYDAEPYLRLTSAGVEENLRSTATYANRTRAGSQLIPDDADPAAPPKWSRISTQPVARFHDHRIHWMGATRPPVVAQSPGRIHHIQDWTVVVRDGEQGGASTWKVNGTLDWIPGPSPSVPLAGAAALAAGLVAAALWAGRAPIRRRAMRVPVMIVASVLVAVDAVHLAGIAGGVLGGSVVGRFLSVGWASVAAWIMVVVAVVLLVRGRDDALYLLTFAGGTITLVGGMADLTVLSRSSVVFAYSITLARTVVALTLGLGVGLVVASVLLTRPLQKRRSATVDCAPSLV